MSQDQERRTAIRTPDQRLRVFVSSTLGECAEERLAVNRAISAMRLTPVLFELGARTHPPQELYRAYLAQSDIFIGVYWQRYGWVGPGMEVSGLEDEFLRSQSMPRLLYIKTPAPEREERLSAMIGRLQTEATNSYKSFRSTRELGRLVREDLAVLLSERFTAQQAGAGPSASVAPSMDAPRLALPSMPTSFVGREAEIAEVASLLETPAIRLVTLTGPGGIGKTRLALAVAERLKGTSPSAVFVPLASITEPGMVLPSIGAQVGASMEGTGRQIEPLVEHLAESNLLLVLDNLEQVVGCGPDLDELLSRCPGVKILATSRTVLRLRAEHEYPVGPLTVPADADRPSVDQLLLAPAIALFVERAGAVRHGFVFDEANAAAVAEICRRVDGLPLAIELAAARVRLLEPNALLERLRSRLDVLGSGQVDLPERQRTLRATIEWSVSLLNQEERDMLAALAVFVDGWTIDAAVSVAGIDEDTSLDMLDRLAGHSLIFAVQGSDGSRFRMLETIRETSAELLAEASRDAGTHHRHAAFFRKFLEDTVWPLPDENAWADRLQAEEGNLRLAVQWFLANDIAPLPHMFRLLWRFWQLRDRMTEGRSWIERLLPRAAELDDLAQAELWLAAAMTALEVGDDEKATVASAEIERLRGRIEDPYLLSAIDMALSWSLPIADDYEGAALAASRAVEGFREQDEPFMAANAVFTLGMLEIATASYADAEMHLAEVHAAGSLFGDNWLTAVACVQLASLALKAGEIEKARDLFEESLVKSLDTERSTLMVTFSLVAFAEIALATGEPLQAARALGAVDGLRTRAGLRPWPLVRRSEARLLEAVQGALSSPQFREASITGSQLSQRDSIAMMHVNTPT